MSIEVQNEATDDAVTTSGTKLDKRVLAVVGVTVQFPAAMMVG